MKNILVPIDFEGNSDLLIDTAVTLVEKPGSKLWLVHVAAPDPDFVGYEAGPQTERDIRAAKLKEEHASIQLIAQGLKEKNINVEALLVQGPTIETILEEAKKLKADMIVVGYNEHSLLHNLWFGNTGLELIKKSKIPILVMPLEKEEKEI